MIELARTTFRRNILGEIAEPTNPYPIERVHYNGLAPIWLQDEAALRDRTLMTLNLLWAKGALQYRGAEESPNVVELSPEGRDLLADWDGHALDALTETFRIEGGIAGSENPSTLISNGATSLELHTQNERVVLAVLALLNAGKQTTIEEVTE